MEKQNSQYILEMVKGLVLHHIGQEAVKIYLFGSWARGEERMTSDIDLAVETEEGTPFSKAAYLREILEESVIPYRVDVVDLAEASEAIIDKVRKEGIPWNG